MDDLIDREEAKRRAAERAAAMLAPPPAPSSLPADPTLTADALALRARGMTPLELFHDVINDEGIDMRTRLDAAKAAAAYMHKAQASTQRVETDADARRADMLDALRRLAADELAAVKVVAAREMSRIREQAA